MTDSINCVHRMDSNGNRGLLTKTTFNKVPIDESLPCVICTNIQPLWKRHKDHPDLHTGYDTSEQPNIQSTQARLRNKYEFILFEDELGETYHVLLSFFCLLWNAGEDITEHFKPKIYTTKKKGLSEIEHLFTWYKVPLRHEQVPYIDEDAKESLRTGYDSRKLATEIITSAFGQCHSIGDITGDHALAPLMNQETIFEVFRGMLDHPYGLFEKEESSMEGLTLFRDYLRPSYSAKFWLNRYLRDTQKRKLPKRDDVTNLAVIHCRRHAASNVGRLMDDDLLKHIASAIQRANYRANYTHGVRFSHVLLYGDFVEAEGREMKGVIARAFENAAYEEKMGLNTTDAPLIEIMYISRPWLPRGKEDGREDDGENNPKVRELWTRFRDSALDPIPLQVKVVAIWTMLCKRYGPKICVIGHRSGFIEGAALVGIPVFYFNGERPPGHEKTGHILCTPTEQKHCSKRLHKLANVMNTLIPMEIFEAQRVDVTTQAGPSSKLKRISSRVQSKEDTQKHQESPRRAQAGSIQQSSKAQKTTMYKFDNRYKDELMPALFMYMCCTLEPWWTGDLHTRAWTARVAMMHDTVSSPSVASVILGFLRDESLVEDQPEVVQQALATYKQQLPKRDKQEQIKLFEKEWCSLSQQTGQKWLWRRFNFAQGRGVTGTYEYGWLFQEWSPARRQLPDQPGVD